jgi:trans-2,3-dihydro-3-hydroxyanthranilate isomerase
VKLDYAFYAAFSDQPFAGSQAAMVANAAGLDAGQMQQIATEFKAPATAFVTSVQDAHINVRFFSTQTEYPMCGHGTIALIPWLIERGDLEFSASRLNHYTLKTPAGQARLTAVAESAETCRVMLELAPASFDSLHIEPALLAELCGLNEDAINTTTPVALTQSDFVHLMIPVTHLSAFEKMAPNFSAIESFSRQHSIDTLMYFSTETVNSCHTVHCREFCPAVGTPEAPATGTTNRALACYLYQYGILSGIENGEKKIYSEQGYEMGRPGLIETGLTIENRQVRLCNVGGIATKVMQGELFLKR